MANFFVMAQALNDYKFEVTKEYLLTNKLPLDGHVLGTDELLSVLRPLLEKRPKPKRGGAMVTVACLLAKLGHKVSLSCNLGNDEGSRFFQESCAEFGLSVIKTSSAAAMGFSCCLTTDEGTRTFITFLGCSGEEVLVSNEMRLQMEGCDYLLIEGFLLDLGVQSYKEILALCSLALSQGKKIVLTLSAEQTVTRQQERFKTISDLAWLLVGNEEEVKRFAGKDSFSGLLIQTSGARGALAQYQENKFSVPATIPDHYVDSIGAGDAFLAGVLDKATVTDDLQQILLKGGKFGALACSYEGTDFCNQELPV